MMLNGMRVRRAAADRTLALLALVAGAALPLAGQSATQVATTPSGGPRALTLPEAVRMAEAARPSVIQARTQIRNADANRRAALGLWLPNATASAQGNQLKSAGQGRIDPATGVLIPGDQTTRSVNFGLNAAVNLFDGFQRYNDKRVAEAQLVAANTGLTDARFQARLQVMSQFYTLLAAQQLLSVREASVRRAEEQLRQSIARLRAGSATRSDSLRSLVALGTAQGNVAAARSSVIGAEAVLGQLVGIDGRASAVDDSSYYALMTQIDTVALAREAAERSPSVQSSEASAAAARAQLKSAKASYYPTLTLSGSYTYNGSSLRNYQLFNQQQLNLGLNWNLFNRFQRERNVDLQLSNLELAEAQAAEQRRIVQATVIAQLAQLDAAQEQIRITRTSVIAATEDLRVQQERYRLGAATIVDVLTSQEALNQAEVDVVNARFGFLNARAQLEAALGRTL